MVSELAYPRQEPVGNDWVGNSVSVKSPNPFRPVAADYGGDFVLQFRTAIHRRWQRLRAQALLRPAALPRLIRSPTRPYSSSGFGGGNDRCMVKVPDIDPSKIPKPASISGKMTKSMVRYEADASDPTAVWRVVHLRPSEEPRELPDQVPPDELEIEKTRSVEDLWQINLNSTQGIQPMGAPEGNLNSPLAGFSVVVTGWEQDSKDSDEVVGKHEVRLDEVIDGLDGAVSGDFGIPSWLFRTPDYMAPEQWNHQKPNQQVNSNPSNCRAPSFFKSLAKGPILDSPEFVGGEPLVEALDSPELVVGEPLVGAVVQKKETTMKSCTTGACKYCGYKWVIGHKCKQSQLVNLMAGDVSDEAPFDLTQLYVVGRADQRLRGTGLFWKLPPWPDFCTMNCDRFAQHCEYEVIEKFYSVKQYNHSALDYTDKFEELIKIWPDLSLCEVYWMAKGMQKELYGLQDLGEDEPIGLTDVETSQLSISASRCGVKNRRVGQQCLAIENPFGFDPTLTVGVISGLNRDIFSKAGVTIEDGAHFHMKQASVVMNSTVSSSKKYFNDRSVPAIEMKIKKLMPMDDESKRLTDWVGKSVYDALQKKDAKFFIIKSYSEDDVHKSVKYNVWASTPNGNKKLDAGYREAREKLSECPVFLFFFVNTSVQFVGVAEMISPVDFDNTVDYWQQDKWNGCFPVTWHIVKDVPNNILKHITLDHNDNKPVTHCHDTQKVKLEQCLEMLKIFKDHVSKTSLMDGLFNSGRTAVAKKLFKSLKVLYKLQLPEGVEIHPGFHDSQLKIHCSPKAISSSDLSLVSKDSKLNTEPILVLENSVVTQWLIPWKNLLPDDASGNNADFIKGAFPGLYSHTINSWVPDQILEDKYYLEEKLLRLFASGSRAVLSSMAMRFGGIVGQKVMKVCYGKLHPNYQFFYFDSVESLPVEPLESGDLKPENTRCAAQVSVFGSKLRKKLEQAKIFMGGSGALGCEFLKNLALMGISCSPDGKLVVSDDDVIEKSNLSRQYLFCDWNSGQPKSTVAATCKRGFVQFYHEPIKQIIKTCMNDQRDKLWPMWRKLGVTMKTDEKELMGKALIKSVQHTVVWKGKKQESVEDVLCGNIVAIVGLKQFITNSANLTIEKETDACPIKTMEFSVFPVVRVTVQCQFAFHLPKLVGSLKLNVLADNYGVKSNRMSVIYPMNGHFQNGHGVAPNGLDGKTGFVSKILEGRAVAALNKFDKNSKMMSDPMWMRRLQPTPDPMVLCTIKESGEQICARIGELHFEICLKILLKMLHGKVLVSLKVHFQHSIHKPVALDLLISILEDKYAVKGEEMSDSADLSRIEK